MVGHGYGLDHGLGYGHDHSHAVFQESFLALFLVRLVPLYLAYNRSMVLVMVKGPFHLSMVLTMVKIVVFFFQKSSLALKCLMVTLPCLNPLHDPGHCQWSLPW
jgi:hypothetical protein